MSRPPRYQPCPSVAGEVEVLFCEVLVYAGVTLPSVYSGVHRQGCACRDEYLPEEHFYSPRHPTSPAARYSDVAPRGFNSRSAAEWNGRLG